MLSRCAFLNTAVQRFYKLYKYKILRDAFSRQIYISVSTKLNTDLEVSVPESCRLFSFTSNSLRQEESELRTIDNSMKLFFVSLV